MADSKNVALYKKYLQKMEYLQKDKRALDIFNAFHSGKNSYMRIDRLESSNFDITWVDEIEKCIYDLGDIIANPRENTKTSSNIVPIELARKINGESVQHLASHTQYIKEVNEKGEVVPNKILNIINEEDIHTYENRFIATLVRRLVLFIEKRYDFIKNFSILHDEEILFYKTKAIVDGAEVEIETKVKIKSDSESDSAEVSNKIVGRIKQIREYILYFYGSKFMKELKTDKDVRNPIHMTNILRKNPKYHHCYELYRFIEKYDRLGVSYKVDEDVSIFSEEELREINTVMVANYLAVKAKDKSKNTKKSTHQYKPRILTSIDDEEFIYGDLLRGPFEFLRIDQGYRDFLEAKNKVEIPPHPTKIEKEYYKEEIKDKAELKAQKAAMDKLEKRRRKEQAEFEKKARLIIAQREREEAERIAREAELARLEEEKRIDAVRKALQEDALKEHGAPVDTPVEESPVVETPIEEVEENEQINEEIPQNPSEIEENNEVLEEQQPQEEAPEEVVEQLVQEEEIQEPVEEENPAEEEPVVEESPVEDIPQEVEANEEPASEEEVQLEEPIQEEVQEEQPVEEAEPQEEVIEEPQPEEVEEQPIEEEQQPEVIEEPVQDIPEEVEETPTMEEEPQGEEPIPEEINEEPVEEQLVEEESIEEFPEEVPEVEETTEEIEESQEPEETQNEPVQEEVVPEEVVEESPADQPQENNEPRKARRLPKAKKEKKAPKAQKQKPEKIPGRFIVKTHHGYYVNGKIWSSGKVGAKVFTDFNEAKHIKSRHGGKVIKV